MDEKLLRLISKQLEEVTRMLAKHEKEPWGKIGRPTKEHIVRQYRQNYPDAKKMQCVREAGLSIKTVSKYWDVCVVKEETKDDQEGVTIKEV